VLENGPSSRYAAYFDVEWDPPESKLRNTVLLPVLGDHYGRVLEKADLRLEREDSRWFAIRYHDQAFPVSPRSLDDFIGIVAERCRSDDLAFIADALGRLPPSTATDVDAVHRRHHDKEVLRGQLIYLCKQHPEILAAIDQRVAEVNADPGSSTLY
jgi:(1->4)-alpha-D-glucan 1-alpha-D-glucosylmutase